jgi:hypothetical protein
MEVTTHASTKAAPTAHAFFGGGEDAEAEAGMEASAAAAAGGGGGAVGDGAACGAAFRVLKAMVQRWLADAAAGSTQADSLLSSLQRFVAATGDYSAKHSLASACTFRSGLEGPPLSFGDRR